MADPVSAEPTNWESDILLKLTMPGKQLRESTILKAQAAEQRREHLLPKPQLLTPPTPTPQPVHHVTLTPPQPAPQPVQHTLNEAFTPQQPLPPPPPSLPTPPAPILFDTPAAPTQPSPVDITPAFNTIIRATPTPEQEWRHRMIQQTTTSNPPLPQTAIPITPPAPVDDQLAPDDVYVNHPLISKTPTHRVWTITPPREDAEINTPFQRVNAQKVHDFAHKLIGTDYAHHKLSHTPPKNKKKTINQKNNEKETKTPSCLKWTTKTS